MDVQSGLGDGGGLTSGVMVPAPTSERSHGRFAPLIAFWGIFSVGYLNSYIGQLN
jgi:hypothetical protein